MRQQKLDRLCRGYKILRPRLTKYCWGRVPGVPGGVDAYGTTRGTLNTNYTSELSCQILCENFTGDSGRFMSEFRPLDLMANCVRGEQTVVGWLE